MGKVREGILLSVQAMGPGNRPKASRGFHSNNE